MRRTLLFAILLPATVTVARADVVDIRWSAEGRFLHNSTVGAGKFVEVCDKLPAGVKVGWSFEAGSALDFNVHYHLGKEAVFPSKLSAVASAKDTLHAKIEQDYCWMWSNKSATPVTLSVTLQRE